MEQKVTCQGIRYLSPEDIVSINKRAISFTPAERHGFIHQNNLIPAQQSPNLFRYYEQCEDIFTLAACLFIKLVKSHIFENANKRTAFMSTVVFLRINGFIFEPDKESSIEIALLVAKNEPDYNDPHMLSSWFKAYSREANVDLDLSVENFTNKFQLKLI